MKQFKRIISLVIALTMLVSMFSVAMVSTSAAVQTYVLGDVDMNGSVEIMDATRVQRHTAAKAGYVLEKGTIEFAAADVNVDGGVTIFDATLIQRYIAKMNTVGIGETFTFGEPDNPDDPSSEDVSSEDVSSEDVSSEDVSSEDESSDDASSEDASSEDESSEDASSEDESSEDTSSDEPAEVTEGYYLVGKLNGESLWSADTLTADRKLKANPAVDGEYYLDWTFYGGDELKVAHFDGTSLDIWYKDQADNYKIGADSDKVGNCTLYFNPDGNSEWSYTYFTVQPKGDPVDPSSEDESSEDASSEDESSEDVSSEDTSSEEPGEVTEGYYLVGELNGESLWSADTLTADRKLKANPGAEGEYMLDWTFYGGDELKVVYFDGTGIKTWYKDQADNYKIGADSDKVGNCTLYFNPDGNSDWSYTYFTVQPKGDPIDPSSEDESSENESSEDVSSEDESSDNPDVAVAGYYLVGTLNGKNCWFVDATSADRMLKANPGAEGEYMLDWTFYGGDE
ncbi:MAG: hypothetical protein IJ015_02685, partial [Ruminococcus sp.]|nr:hypothetical protein [Ruminococcus sp.]